MNVVDEKGPKRSVYSGITFPSGRFPGAIAAALHREYGATHAAVKTVVGLTGANERAVKNWFKAKNGPSGEFSCSSLSPFRCSARNIPSDDRERGAGQSEEDRGRHEEVAGSSGLLEEFQAV
jgi:hypothetical protein